MICPPTRPPQFCEELVSEHKVDVLGQIDPKSAAAILAQMAPEEAREARPFLAYPPESTGGTILGLLLGGVAFPWKNNAYLGLVVGGALAANTLMAVSFGGFLPLALKKLRMDPILVSSPWLTTVTDMCGYFFLFSLATLVLPRNSSP